MKESILNLEKQKIIIEEMSYCFDRIGLDHGSHDQTRAMLIESIFENALNHIAGAISQLEILEKQLY